MGEGPAGGAGLYKKATEGQVRWPTLSLPTRPVLFFFLTSKEKKS